MRVVALRRFIPEVEVYPDSFEASGIRSESSRINIRSNTISIIITTPMLGIPMMMLILVAVAVVVVGCVGSRLG